MATINTDHGRIWFESFDMTAPWIDNPETVVFHHGVGIDHGIWSRWLPLLADRYRLVWFDMLGFGASEIPPDNYEWSMAALADCALAVADAVEAPRFHYVGESLGGALGFYLALHYAGRLFSITPCAAPAHGAAVDWLQEWRQFIADNGMAAWSKRMMERRFPPGVISADLWAWFDGVQAACAPESILGSGEMLIGVDLRAQLPNIRTPTLLITADRSPFVTVPMSLANRDLIPDSDLTIMAGSRHGAVFSHGPACARAFRAFLDRRGPFALD